MSEQSRRLCLVAEGTRVRRVNDSALDRIDELLREPGRLVWLDLLNPGPEEVELLQREFGVHPLAIEDLNKRGQRPKLDTYGDQHVVVAYEVLHAGDETDSDRFEPAELHLFVGRSHVVTAHWTDSPALKETLARFEHRSEAVAVTAGALLYKILDAVVDGYFPVIDRLNERIETLEPELLAGSTGTDALRTLLRLKRTMLQLRRVMTPLRDVANALLRRDLPLVDDEAVPYYNDLYDHLVRVIDSLDLLRDLVAAALDANLAATSNSLNAIMKRLTAFTVVLMVPTLIAGIYGMNFHFMPELNWAIGYPFALGLMALAMIGAITYFRRKGWF